MAKSPKSWRCNFCGHRNTNVVAATCASCEKPHWCETTPEYAKWSGSAASRSWGCNNKAKHYDRDLGYVCSVHLRMHSRGDLDAHPTR